MKRIVALVDYKGCFGSKRMSKFYRSGMDFVLLTHEFRRRDYELEVRGFSDVDLSDSRWTSDPVVYTSQEDFGGLYKSYIEDVVLGLELRGCVVIPSSKYLKATNNKVFMEILRPQKLPGKYCDRCRFFGSYEELLAASGNFSYPQVVKSASGACSLGVHLANDRQDLLRKAKIVSRSMNVMEELKDLIRSAKHKGYRRESLHRNKFIVQEYVAGLDNDWKVLVFWDKYYILRRKNRPGDFRASGSGLFSFDEEVDTDILTTAEEIFQCFDIPMLSLDLAKDRDNKIHLIEMQFVYFGTTTLEKSPYYCIKQADGWHQIHEKSVLEEEYARSVVGYLKIQH